MVKMSLNYFFLKIENDRSLRIVIYYILKCYKIELEIQNIFDLISGYVIQITCNQHCLQTT